MPYLIHFFVHNFYYKGTNMTMANIMSPGWFYIIVSIYLLYEVNCINRKLMNFSLLDINMTYFYIFKKIQKFKNILKLKFNYNYFEYIKIKGLKILNWIVP